MSFSAPKGVVSNLGFDVLRAASRRALPPTCVELGVNRDPKLSLATRSWVEIPSEVYRAGMAGDRGLTRWDRGVVVVVLFLLQAPWAVPG